MSDIFRNGNGVIVNAKGPGKLHLLTYGGISANLGNVVGSVGTTNSGITRFLISFSHNYTRFAFYWEGAGEAAYGTSESLARYPVAKNWDNAVVIHWGSPSFTSGNVNAEVNKAVGRDNQTTVFIIPEL